MDARKIDLKDFVESGAGATSISYNCLYDENIMLKLFNPEHPLEPIFDELEVASKVYNLGIPTPEPGEVVTDGEKTGILYRRIIGKRSFSRMLSDEPERIDEFAAEFAEKTKEIHRIQCPEGMFPKIKDQLLFFLDQDKVFTQDEKRVIRQFIIDTPDELTALHGDLQMGNLISTLKKGQSMDSPHEVYFIDLGNFQTGHYMYDLGMLEMICLYCNDDYLENDYHINRETAIKFWKLFVRHYFGQDADYDSICRTIDRYCFVKCFQVEYYLSFLPENYIPQIRRAFELD